MSIKELKRFTTDNAVYAVENSKGFTVYKGTEAFKGGTFLKPAGKKLVGYEDAKGRVLPKTGLRVFTDIYYSITCISIGTSLTERVTIPVLPEKLPQNFWDVVEKHLPGYDHRDDVGENNSLAAYLDGSTPEVPPILEGEANKKATGKKILKASNTALYAEALGYSRGYYAVPTETWEITVRLELPQGHSPVVVDADIRRGFVARMSEHGFIPEFQNIEASITDLKKVKD